MTFSAWDRDSFFNGSEKAIGWLHNTSYWWGNLYMINPIVTQCIDNGEDGGYWVPGAPLDTDDSYNYANRRDDPDNGGDTTLTNYTDYTLKVQGLRKLKWYEISWYYTDTGLPTFISDEDKTDIIGTAKFNIPSVLTENYGDLGFKVRWLENKSLMITDSTAGENIQKPEPLNGFEVKVYPNPARDLINIESTTELDHAEIYAIDGSLIQTFSIMATGKQFHVNLQAGYYTVVVYSRNNEVVSKKLCILR